MLGQYGVEDKKGFLSLPLCVRHFHGFDFFLSRTYFHRCDYLFSLFIYSYPYDTSYSLIEAYGDRDWLFVTNIIQFRHENNLEISRGFFSSQPNLSLRLKQGITSGC